MIKRMTLLVVVIILMITGCAKKSGSTYLNLDFEDLTIEGKPKYWTISGNMHNFMDRYHSYSGEISLCMENNDDTRVDLCRAKLNYYYGFPIEEARGKRVTFSGYIKTQALRNGSAGIRAEIETQGFGNAISKKENQPLFKGTTSWTECSLEVDVPKDASRLLLSAFMEGVGKCWFDCFSIALDGKTYEQVKPVPLMPRPEDLQWIRKNAIPFVSANPGRDHSQLLPLKEVIGTSRIVALGEGTHGTSEFFKMKHRILRFLVEEMGFSVFAIEANMPEARAVNHYILTGEGDPVKALAGLMFWTWDTQEVLDMIEWMREYNKRGLGRVEFYGIDSQLPLDALAGVRDFVRKYDPHYLPTLSVPYDKIVNDWNGLMKNWVLHNVDFEKWQRDAEMVLDHLEANREKYLQQCTVDEYEWAVQYADIVMQAAEMYILGKRDRDRSMARNLSWILGRKPQGTKIVVWAHNAHVSKDFHHFPSLGSYLSPEYGTDYISFAFAFHRGTYTAVGPNNISVYGTSSSEPGSLEWFLKSSGIENFILDIRKAGKGEPGSHWLKQELFFRGIGAVAKDFSFSLRPIDREYDAVIFFEESTPTDCFRLKKTRE